MSENTDRPRGPLHGVKVLEIGGIGPVPFAGMMLSDMGADILRIERPNDPGLAFPPAFDPTKRGRAAVPVDTRSEAGRELVLGLAEQADALIEGFRPGVMEKLGLGPEDVHARNPRLTYGRMTGFGQDGPMAKVAGHDINYISVAGALGAMRRAGEAPLAPLNLVGDYGGGAMFLAFGIVCGIVEARTSGQGQVVDAAMVDGTALLTSLQLGLSAGGAWAADKPGTNLLDSGAHFYETYETSDGGHVSVGAIEPQFYAKLIELMGLTHEEVPQFETARWPEFKGRFAEVFRTKTRQEWADLLEPEDTCATAVLTLGEAAGHPHMQARGTFVEVGGVLQAQAAPRFSRTPGEARPRREDSGAALAEWGIDAGAQDALRAAGAFG
ncbi:CoA transferase [Paraconexibacter antarcticus]|uniref:CoA transferase n=1 Tax=Paraconexibacter antarcticus TaxID=2949664 RepID=A0ABY5DS57_9ACTN|nr:CaiB/BaiF CoA-transferase family protein [Paraconexibacter antarcticus]UTI63647.1 CoA transferase [Paraconexibacter antarcticus]